VGRKSSFSRSWWSDETRLVLWRLDEFNRSDTRRLLLISRSIIPVVFAPDNHVRIIESLHCLEHYSANPLRISRNLLIDYKVTNFKLEGYIIHICRRCIKICFEKIL
jgi:hypothetical protein